jgi:hypothetical protein
MPLVIAPDPQHLPLSEIHAQGVITGFLAARLNEPGKAAQVPLQSGNIILRSSPNCRSAAQPSLGIGKPTRMIHLTRGLYRRDKRLGVCFAHLPGWEYPGTRNRSSSPLWRAVLLQGLVSWLEKHIGHGSFENGGIVRPAQPHTSTGSQGLQVGQLGHGRTSRAKPPGRSRTCHRSPFIRVWCRRAWLLHRGSWPGLAVQETGRIRSSWTSSGRRRSKRPRPARLLSGSPRRGWPCPG